ncbi:MAG: methylamine utilization protein [Burkholderiales bacterium]|jgi:plastocyanin|nr:MAG: methylamine utilization protein [Burkholderiales bacterium]
MKAAQTPASLGLLVCLGLMHSTCWALVQQIKVLSDTGQPVAGAAVSVFVKGVKPTASPGTTADMAQRDKNFAPKLRIVQTGTSVNFPNFDTVRHHVYSFSSIKTFEIRLYAGTPAAPIVFDKPGTATLGCNIHDRMLGYIHVVDTPYFGVSDANGQVTVDIPAGEHQLRVWLPTMGEANPGLEQPFKTATEAVVIRVKP